MSFQADNSEDFGVLDGPGARIRDALLDLCFESGFEQVTAAALCRRAGIDRVSFGRRYSDLEGCFFEVYSGELDRYRREAARARARVSDWRGQVRATAYALYRFLADDERVRHFTVVEVRGAGERTQLLVGEEIESLIDLLDRGRAEPGASASLTRATAESIGGGIFNQMYAAAGRSGPMPAEHEIITALMYGVVLPYLGPEAAQEELHVPPPSDPDA